MDVLNATNFFQKIRQVIRFREACKLRGIVKSDVDYFFDARFLKSIKEISSCCFCKAYRCKLNQLLRLLTSTFLGAN